jgi:cyclophilin family peptidyl-prolyl cis-trans isomerase
MSNKKRSTKPNQRAAKNRRSAKTSQNVMIQRVAIAIVALALIGIIWVTATSNKAKQSTGQSPQLVGTRQYAAAPSMTIDTNKQYTAAVKMAKGGEFVIQLYADKAPITVNSFVFLARQGYFDGLTFHRVLQGFMAQGGDPTGTGGGGPGYQFVNEDSDLKFDKAGVVAMANAGRDTNGSQFFITFGPQEGLNGGYTIFGQVTSGMDVVSAITLRDPDQNPSFSGDAIQSITIAEK